jgi:hypothetical protein
MASVKEPTASTLGRYYSELLSAGLPDQLAQDLVRELGFGIRLNDGIVLADEESAA